MPAIVDHCCKTLSAICLIMKFWYHYRNIKVKQNTDGWATPLVVGEHYKMWFSVDTSPESMRLEVTNLLPAPINTTAPPEHIYLTFNYTQVRFTHPDAIVLQ